MPVQYREMQGDDIVPCVELAKELHGGATQHWIPFDYKETMYHVGLCLYRDDRQCFVAFDGNDVVGGIVCVISKSQGSKELEAREAGIFVKENYRKMGIGQQLIKMLEQWGIEKGALSVIVGDSTLSEQYSIGRVLVKEGFDLFSRVYRKKL